MFTRDKHSDTVNRPESGPDLLREEGLLAPWFLSYRLDEELERARRYDRPLAVLVVRPVLLPGETLLPAARSAAIESAASGCRRFDLLGPLEDGGVIVVMPETSASEARAAVERIRQDMWRRSIHVGGQKWNVLALDDAPTYPNADALLGHAVLTKTEARAA